MAGASPGSPSSAACAAIGQPTPGQPAVFRRPTQELFDADGNIAEKAGVSCMAG